MSYEFYYLDERYKEVLFAEVNREKELSKEELDGIASWNSDKYGVPLQWRKKY